MASTPLWRNGPPEKPVLCNACGSRYRIRGTLANYAPKHAQLHPLAKRAKIISSKSPVPNKGNNLRIKEEEEEEGDCFTDNVCYSTDSDDSTSHNSISDDSAVSYSQNCYNVEEEEGDGIQGETQGSLWKTSVPSRKRSLVVHRSLTPIERFQRDLFNILKYEEVGRPNLSEDLLIYDANNLQISCNEIGLGTILLAPMEAAVDETLSSPSDVRISGFNESQNRSSPMDELKLNKNNLLLLAQCQSKKSKKSCHHQHQIS
eukprot:XP_025014796.1 GATA transcription factor 26-like [Ricinus communis]